MVAGPVFWRNISHDDPYKAVIRATTTGSPRNIARRPRRLIGMGVMPIANAGLDRRDGRCKKLGLKGIQLSALPNGQGYPTPRTTGSGPPRSISTCGDHVSCSTTPARAPISRQKYPKETRSSCSGCAAVSRMAVQFRLAALSQHRAMVLGGVFGAIQRQDLFRRDAARLGPFWLGHMDLWYKLACRVGRAAAKP
jgi:hypothetical protein